MEKYCVLERIISTEFKRRKQINHLFIPFLWAIIFFFTQNFYHFVLICRTAAISGPLRNYLHMIVSEKSDRRREYQFIMGLNETSYYIGWTIACLLQTYICSIFYQSLEFIFKIITFHLNNDILNNLGLEFIYYQLFVFSMVGQMLLISSFYTSGRRGAEFYIFFNILVYTLFFLRLDNNFLPFLIPQMYLPKNVGDLIIFPVQGFVSIILYVYFDQILYGKQKSPLFFLKVIFKRKNQVEGFDFIDQQIQQQNIMMDQNLLYHSEYFQEEEIKEQAMIQIFNLTKKYKSTSLVDHLNLNLYSNQIFCLLGHNGAGKSTTLNMITGSLKKDEGNIIINNMDIDYRLKDIRKILGYFAQIDMLYPDLTVNEHLIFYGKIKLISDATKLQESIDHLLDMCELKQEQQQLCKYLSGGGQRKLSLAIALMGNSQVILLDEPTTGLDPISRQQVWSILKKIKKDKCIVMTTHFMDEAQELADRIGIIQQGKLIVCGTVDYIKRQFSVGYNITMKCQNEELRIKLSEQIQHQINGLCEEEQQYISKDNVIQVNIPYRNGKYIGIILEYLEKLQSIQVIFKMTSLEDAYQQVHFQLYQNDESIETQIKDYVEICDGIKPKQKLLTQINGLIVKKLFFITQDKGQYLLLIGTQIILLLLFYQFNNNVRFFYEFYALIRYLFIIQIAYQPMYDKQQKIKISLISHGMNTINYWISNFIFDAIIEAIIVILLIYLACLELFTGLQNRFFNGSVLLAFLYYYLFSLNFVLQTYAATILFNNIQSSLIFLPYLYFFQLAILDGYYYFCNGNIFLSYVLELFFPLFSFLDFRKKNQLSELGHYMFMVMVSCTFYLFFTIIIDCYLHQKPPSCVEDHIQVDQIYQQFKDKEILNNISFTVKPKQIYGLLGQNGSGKTAMINILTRIEKPKRGTIEIYNQISDLGYVPQHFPLWEDLTPKQHLIIYGYIKGLNKDNINKFIRVYGKIMDLEKIENKRIQYLSIGEKRKLLIGIALIGGSSKLLLDEPTSGVDPVYRKEFQQLIKQGCQINGNSVVLTTHSFQDAEEICDLIGIMIKGQLKFNGTINEFRSQFKNRIKITFQLKNNEYQQKLNQIITQKFKTGAQQIGFNQISYLISLETFQLSEIFRFCSSRTISYFIQDFEIQKATLDQVFKNYIQEQENIENRNLNEY